MHWKFLECGDLSVACRQEPGAARFALPALRPFDPLVSQSAGAGLADAARPLLRLPRADFGPLSARRGTGGGGVLRRGAVGFRPAGKRPPCVARSVAILGPVCVADRVL